VASSEVRTSNPQVARVDNRLSTAGAPPPEKKKAVSGDQEGCGQTSQQTSPDWFEGEENAQENVWSEQAYEHRAKNEHGA